MRARMRTLRLYFYCTALAGLLFGIADAITLALGGATADGLMAQGFVFLALATGLRHQEAGHVPLRASFALLGLAGLLPALAGYAPIGAAFCVFLFLPLRATGARLSAAMREVPAGASMLVLGAFCAWMLLQANAPGLPGFLFLWVAAGLLQRMVVPSPAKETQPSPAPSIPEVVPNLLLGAGVGLAFLHLSPFAAMFDHGAQPQDWSRALALGVAFFATWFTLGSGFAETKLRLPILTLLGVGTGLSLGTFSRYAAHLASPEGYMFWVKHPRVLKAFQPDAPALPEEHAAYVPLFALAMFAIPAALAALLLRTSMRRDGLGVGPLSLAPLCGGLGVALLGTSLLPETVRMEALPMAGAIFLLAGGLAATGKRVLQLPGLIVAGLVVLLVLPNPQHPIMRYSLVDAFIWHNVLPTEEQAWDGKAVTIQQEDLYSFPRLLTVESPDGTSDLDNTLLFDKRNRLAALETSLDGRRAEALLAFALAGAPEQVCWVGAPQVEVVRTLLQEGAQGMTFATDPPAVARLGLAKLTLPKESPLQPGQGLDFHRSLAHCDGPFGLILFDGAAMWDGRHNLLRNESLRQAALRLEADGTCAFLLSPDQVVPGMLPQWFADFSSVFPQSRVLLLPDGLSRMRIAFLGRKGEADTPWPMPSSAMQVELQRFGLPLQSEEDLASLTVDLKPSTGGSHWMFRGPFRPADAALAPTLVHTIDGLRSVDRSAAVLKDLLAHEVEGGTSLLAFYAAQFEAQEYSVHDTYADQNPYAIETSEAALEHLMRTTLAAPRSVSLERLWGDVGVNLVESREIQWLDTYYGRLFHELGWSSPQIRLGLAHAAMEMLDYELALEHLDRILEEAPNFLPAKELKRLAEAEEQVPRDEHAGHNH